MPLTTTSKVVLVRCTMLASVVVFFVYSNLVRLKRRPQITSTAVYLFCFFVFWNNRGGALKQMCTALPTITCCKQKLFALPRLAWRGNQLDSMCPVNCREEQHYHCLHCVQNECLIFSFKKKDKRFFLCIFSVFHNLTKPDVDFSDQRIRVNDDIVLFKHFISSVPQVLPTSRSLHWQKTWNFLAKRTSRVNLQSVL